MIYHHQDALSLLQNMHQPIPDDALTNSLSTSISTLPTILTSVKVFDGSEITNTVVVSNTFWSSLASKLPALLLAQFLAAVTFILIASVVSSQGKFILDQVISNDDDNIGMTRRRSQFRKANDPPPRSLDFTKLLICICIDILGSANEAIPLVGEVVDVIYAPIAALLLRQLFSGSNIIFLLEFTEEILPFTDILPLATICWMVESFFGEGNLARSFKIGHFAPDRLNDGDFIDVETTRLNKNGSYDNAKDGERQKQNLIKGKE